MGIAIEVALIMCLAFSTSKQFSAEAKDNRGPKEFTKVFKPFNYETVDPNKGPYVSDEELIHSIAMATRNMRSQLQAMENMYGPIGQYQESSGSLKSEVQSKEAISDTSFAPAQPAQDQRLSAGMLSDRRNLVSTKLTDTKEPRKVLTRRKDNNSQQTPRGFQKTTSGRPLENASYKQHKERDTSTGKHIPNKFSAITTISDYDLGDREMNPSPEVLGEVYPPRQGYLFRAQTSESPTSNKNIDDSDGLPTENYSMENGEFEDYKYGQTPSAGHHDVHNEKPDIYREKKDYDNMKTVGNIKTLHPHPEEESDQGGNKNEHTKKLNNISDEIPIKPRRTKSEKAFKANKLRRQEQRIRAKSSASEIKPIAKDGETESASGFNEGSFDGFHKKPTDHMNVPSNNGINLKPMREGEENEHLKLHHDNKNKVYIADVGGKVDENHALEEGSPNKPEIPTASDFPNPPPSSSDSSERPLDGTEENIDFLITKQVGLDEKQSTSLPDGPVRGDPFTNLQYQAAHNPFPTGESLNDPSSSHPDPSFSHVSEGTDHDGKADCGSEAVENSARAPEKEDFSAQRGAGSGHEDVSSEDPEPDHEEKRQPPEDAVEVGLFSNDPSNATLLATYTGVTHHIENLTYKKTAYEDFFNDPYWEKQWYSQDYRTVDGPVMDHNVVPVYNLGYTGKGVVVAVVDDGIQRHPDLNANYAEELSYDVGQERVGAEPDPPGENGERHAHGTECAGEIAMEADNEICGVGVAFEATLAGIKTFGKRTAEFSEGKSLSHGLDRLDIYSCSWGPPDDGVSMQPLGHLQAEALRLGVTQGRDRKGAVYVFAGGNGRQEGDTCGADAVVNSVHTVAVSAVTQRGKTTYYSERCAAVFCAAYSGGVRGEEYVTTTTLDDKCTKRFTGTSAAVPQVSGIIALVLDANRNLTNRDVMHIITMGAEVAPLADNPADIWQRTSMGLWVSNDFGFGILNALNMVRLAENWNNVPKMKTCVVSVKIPQPTPLVLGKGVRVNLHTEACQDSENDQVFFLEKTQLMVTIEFAPRGALTVALVSARKTRSVLLETRKNDNSMGMVDWMLATVHNWGEDPKGDWAIEIKANPMEGVASKRGEVHKLTLILHGTAERPEHHPPPQQRPPPPLRSYSAFRLRDGRTSDDPL